MAYVIRERDDQVIEVQAGPQVVHVKETAVDGEGYSYHCILGDDFEFSTTQLDVMLHELSNLEHFGYFSDRNSFFYN